MQRYKYARTGPNYSASNFSSSAKLSRFQIPLPIENTVKHSLAARRFPLCKHPSQTFQEPKNTPWVGEYAESDRIPTDVGFTSFQSPF